MKIVSASVSRKEMGRFEIEQKYTMDATEDFKEYIRNWDENDSDYEEEVMGAFGDYDYISIDNDELFDQLNRALTAYPEVDYYIDDIYVSVGTPIGYPTDSTTMDQIWEALKKVEITVDVRLSYEILNFDKIETDLAKIVISGNPEKVKKVSEASKETTAGAHDISFELKGEATRTEIEKAFKEQQAQDAMYDEDEDGYSGDFRTVNRVDFKHLGKVFETMDEAYEFGLDKAEKWETVVALYYKAKNGKVNTLVVGWGAS
jgi:hypothetical protein